jgi:hypothetical protein
MTAQQKPVARLKELALDYLRKYEGDAAAFYKANMFDSATIARYRSTDSEFDRRWRAVREGNRQFTFEQRLDKFLELVRAGKSASRAARVAGIPLAELNKHKADDNAFAIAWEEAIEEGTDVLEDTAYDRAVTGITKPVFYKGERVDEIVEYDHGLLVTLLQARRPWKYKKFADANPTAVGPSLALQADLGKLSAAELAQLYRDAVTALNDGK